MREELRAARAEARDFQRYRRVMAQTLGGVEAEVAALRRAAPPEAAEGVAEEEEEGPRMQWLKATLARRPVAPSEEAEFPKFVEGSLLKASERVLQTGTSSYALTITLSGGAWRAAVDASVLLHGLRSLQSEPRGWTTNSK